MATLDVNAIEVWSVDGTGHQVGIRNIYVNDKGNLCIETSEDAGNTSKGSINIEAMKNIQLKPGGSGDVRFYTDHTDDLEQVVVHAFDGTQTVKSTDDDIPVRMKVNCTELELNNKDSVDRETGESIASDGMDLKFKSGSKFVKGRIKATGIDIRGSQTKAGGGGGIAVQISGCDSNYKENKFKIETDRIADISDSDATKDTYSSTYNGEGGQGIEIFTMNSKFFSAFSGSYRFKADAPIYAATRGALETDATTGKVDYPTQSDDSKDILSTDSCTWADIIAAVKYLKAQGAIS